MATTPKFNGALMADDCALKGWKPIELSRRARVADMTVYRFFSGERQTAPIAKKLARALGYQTAKRYLIPSQRADVNEAVAS